MLRHLKAFGLIIFSSVFTICGLSNDVFAEQKLTIYPESPFVLEMKPGESKTKTMVLAIGEENDSEEPTKYKIELQQLAVKNGVGDSSLLKQSFELLSEWVELEETSVELKPNEKTEIKFSVTVPEDAQVGGRYATFAFLKGSTEEEAQEEKAVCKQDIYLNILSSEGDITSGEDKKIESLEIPNLLLSGDFEAKTKVINNGGTNASLYQTLRIYPLSSETPYYSNELEPKADIVLPFFTQDYGIAVDNLPKFGIYRVVYEVMYGKTFKKLEKYVFICPTWAFLLFLGVVIIFVGLIVFKLGKRRRLR